MSLTDLGEVRMIGPLAGGFGETTSVTISSAVADAVDEGAAAFLTAPKAGTIDAIGVRVLTLTTNPTVITYGCVTRDGSGNPTGTAAGASATATSSITTTGAKVLTLSSTLTVAKGDIVVPRVWLAGAGNITFGSRSAGGASGAGGPYSFEFAATAWTRQQNFPCVAARYSDGTWIGIPPLNASSPLSTAYGSGSTPNEVGGLVVPAFTYRCVGFAMLVDPGATSDTGDVTCYDSGGSVLGNVSIAATDWVSASAQKIRRYWDEAPFTLTAGQSYRVAYLATSAGTRQVAEWAVPTSADRNAPLVFPTATTWSKTSRTNSGGAGAWTDDNTVVPLWGLLVDQIDTTSSPVYFFGVPE